MHLTTSEAHLKSHFLLLFGRALFCQRLLKQIFYVFIKLLEGVRFPMHDCIRKLSQMTLAFANDPRHARKKDLMHNESW
ncbi:hypothetical protein CDL12_27500 [Handroanthus impetiginosus]|uniref:Uncharacterized protein n=1 Tax=Handroanthus impetiginosus TaxID=429701 RepID=A0A2G9G3V1_9LAMI|nr:hypothetical protein CDL12_27500 [Handroanthus impetiginosus]